MACKDMLGCIGSGV